MQKNKHESGQNIAYPNYRDTLYDIRYPAEGMPHIFHKNQEFFIDMTLNFWYTSFLHSLDGNDL